MRMTRAKVKKRKEKRTQNLEVSAFRKQNESFLYTEQSASQEALRIR